MDEVLFEKAGQYTTARVSLASPEQIRKWSHGEVKKPETINYRTYRAERDGLFCERIFGPERDWECFCGKYKGIKYRKTICDRCGVEVTHSRVRRKRMGHISLAAPVVHIWFFRSLPSRLSILLGIKTPQLSRVIYFQDYVVIDPGETPLKRKQILGEDDYRQAVEKYGEHGFKVGMGAEAVKALLQAIDLAKMSAELRVQLSESRSKQKTKDIVKRLQLVESMRDSGNRPEWMVIDVLPVIPPDLRPLVLLESGNFATSDLNDLYRRIINRNNRLKKLLDLNAPEVIIRNEKRMLQSAVDALFDNARCRRSVVGSSNRPLKSLTDMISRKQGRFRENLLGKRVDYSGRSVIVTGPELKLHQCGLPKSMALELFQPFIIRRLRELGYADTIKSAKRMLERRAEEVWDILEEVIQHHPVLLNRAPTLHRMGVQAFEPVLVEGNAIRIHPLVCESYNADFDGDTMAVYLPLSYEAQIEARTLMLSTNNIFSPRHGRAIIRPTREIILGCYYLTVALDGLEGEGRRFSSADELLLAYEYKKVALHAKVKLRLAPGTDVIGEDREAEEPEKNMVTTTAGRARFNDILPEGMPYYNCKLDDKFVNEIVAECHERLGVRATVEVLDRVKELGFREATRAGLSISISDLKEPPSKWDIIRDADKQVARIEANYRKGLITEGERYNQVVDVWAYATERMSEDTMKSLRSQKLDGKAYVNPVAAMEASGARGNILQIRQLCGMRGLMARPSGKIIETPIKSSIREGLNAIEYFSSTHGARKGSADTALKTAESGYLTRKMADVAQSVIVTNYDCGTLNGITKGVVKRGEKVEVPLSELIRGRVARDTIVDIVTDEVIVRENEMITEEMAKRIEGLGYEKIRVRSPLTCEERQGICAKCYGMDLSSGKLVEVGLAAGIIAAQSIGEPGTQLTMRTFHVGGTASRIVAETEIRPSASGRVKFNNLHAVEDEAGNQVVLRAGGELIIVDEKERELEKYSVPVGATVFVKEGAKIAARKVIVKWDAHTTPILSDVKGNVRFDGMVEDKTFRTEYDPSTKIHRKVIIEHKGDLHPQVIVENDQGEIEAVFPIPEKAHVEVEEGRLINAGTIIAKTPKEATGTQDITGGLPRVTELLEARMPRSPSVISEIDGVVELGEKRRGKRVITVRSESGMVREHLVPGGKHILVHRGDFVRAGDPLVDGPLVLHDILRIKGAELAQQYILREVQSVYRTFGVMINDKHVEIIISRMMRKVQVTDAGDSSTLPGLIVDRFHFNDVRQRVLAEEGKLPSAEPVLQGITKAALGSESFLSAASFQDTTKVFTQAALAGKVDPLVGLKENVMLGNLIPVGTGFRAYHEARIRHEMVIPGEEAAEEGEATAAAS